MSDPSEPLYVYDDRPSNNGRVYMAPELFASTKWSELSEQEKRDRPIVSLGLTKQTLNRALSAGYFVVDDLWDVSAADLLRKGGIPRRSVLELGYAMSSLCGRHSLTMLPEIIPPRTRRAAYDPFRLRVDTYTELWDRRPGPLWPQVERHQGAWVYFIRADNYIKIGIAAMLIERIKSLQTASPHRLRLWLAIPVDGSFSKAEELENILHQKFSPYRVRGEWFVLSKPIVRFVREARDHARVTRERVV